MFMLFVSEGHLVWFANLSIAIFFLFLLVDWISFVIIFAGGISLAVLTYTLIYGGFAFAIAPNNSHLAAYMCFFALIIGVTFSRQRERIQHEREKVLKALAGMIAHEANTPIASIQMICEELQEIIPPLTTSHAKAIQAGLVGNPPSLANLDAIALLPGALSDQLNRIRYVVKSLANNIKDPHALKDATYVSIGDMITAAIDQYPFDIGEESLVYLELPDDFKIRTDPLLFTQALHNLFKNALYASRHVRRPGKITIQTLQDNGQNLLIITDNGCGIPAHKLPEVFDVFMTTKRNGMGLGLAFVKKVVVASGGEIMCTSEQNSYPEFKLIFNE
jgi:two-component system CAI-1 autoinducer sensor kinase/phosphatase CqsS